MPALKRKKLIRHPYEITTEKEAPIYYKFDSVRIGDGSILDYSKAQTAWHI